MQATDGSRGDGEYRRWDGVRLVGDVLVSLRPLSATRLNDAGVATVDVLDGAGFRSPAAVARETAHDTETVNRLLEQLHQRGFLEWRPDRDPTHRPPVSVVVTVRDDRENLRSCLDALAALDYPAYEVIVVDDGSTDGTTGVASAHELAEERRVRTVSVGSAEEPLGIGASRNRGVEAATNGIVAFTDADCRPRPDWLSELVPGLAEHDLIGGRIRPAGTTAASVYEGINSSLDMGRYASRVDRDGDTPYLATANLVGRREVFEFVKFPERDVAEDVELCWRALDAGFSVVYSSRGVVEHVYRSGVWEFATRRSAYGLSEALLARNHGRNDTGSVDVSVTVLVATALAFLALSTTGRASSVAFVGLVCLGGTALGYRGLGLWRRYRQLPAEISLEAVFRSRAREQLSSVYAFSREVTRYYAVVLVGCGLLAVAVGAETLGLSLVVWAGAALLVALLTEYLVFRPAVSVPAYAAYYLADHLGYQQGVYRGAFRYRTLTHVTPTARFRFVGPGMGTVKRLFGRPGGKTEREVWVGDVSARFSVESAASQWWFEDTTLGGERPVVADVVARLDGDDVFLDIGANVGLYSCLAGSAGGTVVACEPHPATADRLTRNLAENDVGAEVVRKALGSTAGRGILQTPSGDPSNGKHRLVTPEATDGGSGRALSAGRDTPDGSGDRVSSPTAAETRRVAVETGDALVASSGASQPTVVKIDVEGAEAAVLSGLQETLGHPACRLVYCEIHPGRLGERGGSPELVRETLRAHGFTVETLQTQPDGRSIVRARRSPGDSD